MVNKDSKSVIINQSKIQNIISDSIHSKILECDVIIKNEQRMFIGLKYDKTISTAPVIILQADERLNPVLLKVQEHNEVQFYDDRPLARELYEVFNEGDILTDKYYKCIADIYSHLPKFVK